MYRCWAHPLDIFGLLTLPFVFLLPHKLIVLIEQHDHINICCVL